MALGALRLALVLLAMNLADFSNCTSLHFAEYITPNCHRYQLPACPRDLSPVCGSDLVTYANECTLCETMREFGYEIKIIRREPCRHVDEKERALSLLD